MRAIILECYRVLDNHRVFVFNVSDVVDNDKMDKINAFGNRKIPLPAYFITMFEECGFTYVDDIIWDKGEVQSSRHKNGNKPFPFFQYACNCYEHILIFHKHRLEKDIKYPCSDCGSLNVKSNSYTSRGLRSWECKNPNCERSESDRGKRFSLKTIMTQNPFRQQENVIPKELVQEWRRDIRKLSPVIKINSKKENKLGHTAPFPMDIPLMSTYYYSYRGEIVLDVFAGSFTTAIAAQKPKEKVKELTPEERRAKETAAFKLETRNQVGMLVIGGGLILLAGLFTPASFMSHFIVFVLSVYVGVQVIWNVSHSLHTPLMAVTNAISSIIILGALMQIGSGNWLVVILAALSVFMAGINIFGGFMVTRRMLAMFQKS
jgi:DNA modification methylase